VGQVNTAFHLGLDDVTVHRFIEIRAWREDGGFSGRATGSLFDLIVS
jgi:hypothetical protein